MSLRLSGGRRLQSPPGSAARPTPSRVRLALMNILARQLPGCRWLDLCSGSGVMACEALQRGAAVVVAVDQDRRNAAVARTNLEAVQTGLGSQAAVRVDCRDVCRWLEQTGESPFHLIYADPPYASGLHGAIAAAVAEGGWLRPEGTLILECASQALPTLPAGWRLHDQRRYGTTALLLLRQDRGVCAEELESTPAKS
jgi:16S rRNA (guanine966-N2)-methyltransferase